MTEGIQNQGQLLTCSSKEMKNKALFLPSRLVLSSDAFQQVVELIENPPLPTAAMMELMLGNSAAPTDLKAA